MGLALGLASPSWAQDADPLADEEAWRAGVTPEGLAAAQEARASCNQLVDDVNELVRQWDAVRVGTLGRDTLAGAVDDAERLWRRHRAACEGAITQLPAGAITESVLTFQRQQLDAVWTPLVALCRAWLDGAGPDGLATHAARYAQQLAAYASWLEASAVFWEGGYLDREVAPGCLEDARAEARQLAREVRQQMVVPPADREAIALQRLRARRTGLANSLGPCRESGGLNALQEVELGLLDRQLGAYTLAIDGLANGDPRKLEQAMDEEQSVTERLMRCRQEHAEASVTPACAPPAP